MGVAAMQPNLAVEEMWAAEYKLADVGYDRSLA